MELQLESQRVLEPATGAMFATQGQIHKETPTRKVEPPGPQRMIGGGVSGSMATRSVLPMEVSTALAKTSGD